MHTSHFFYVSLLLATAALGSGAQATTATEQLAVYTAQASAPADAARVQKLFSTKHGKEWSCASCHSTVPTADGKHASTGKVIAPLAPAFNSKSFTDPAKTEKWFRRNCNDVMGRVCSPAEKADVLAWLLTLTR